jgi:hypothetical protein
MDEDDNYRLGDRRNWSDYSVKQRISGATTNARLEENKLKEELNTAEEALCTLLFLKNSEEEQENNGTFNFISLIIFISLSCINDTLLEIRIPRFITPIFIENRKKKRTPKIGIVVFSVATILFLDILLILLFDN